MYTKDTITFEGTSSGALHIGMNSTAVRDGIEFTNVSVGGSLSTTDFSVTADLSFDIKFDVVPAKIAGLTNTPATIHIHQAITASFSLNNTGLGFTLTLLCDVGNLAGGRKVTIINFWSFSRITTRLY